MAKITFRKTARLQTLRDEVIALKDQLRKEGYPSDTITSAANAATELNTLALHIADEINKQGR